MKGFLKKFSWTKAMAMIVVLSIAYVIVSGYSVDVDYVRTNQSTEVHVHTEEK